MAQQMRLMQQQIAAMQQILRTRRQLGGMRSGTISLLRAVLLRSHPERHVR